MADLSGVLGRVPGLAGYLGARQIQQQEGAQELAQAQNLMGILSAAQQQQQRNAALQREEAFRGALGALGPNATQEQLAQVASRFGTPDAIMRTQQGSLDRAAQRDNAATMAAAAREERKAALQERLTDAAISREERANLQRELAQMQIQGRQDMMQLAASLRPPRNEPAPTVTDIVDPATGRVQKIDAKTGRVIGLSPADTKLTGAYNADTASLESTTSAMNRLAQEANRMLQHPGLTKATGAMSVVPLVGGVATIPGTDAANFKAGLDTLKSQVGFGVLQAMRDASKTGGALGAISDKENVMLQNNLAALDRAQSAPEFKAALGRILEYTEGAKGRLRNAYNVKHSGRAPTGAEPAAAPSGWSIKPVE